jgi:hypothetical protein
MQNYGIFIFRTLEDAENLIWRSYRVMISVGSGLYNLIHIYSNNTILMSDLALGTPCLT